MKKILLLLLIGLTFSAKSQTLNWRYYDSVQVWPKFNIRNLPQGQPLDSLLSRNSRYNTQRIHPNQLLIPFVNIQNKPSTLAGYGISDGYPLSNPSGYINRTGISITNIGSGNSTYNPNTGIINIPPYSPAVSSVFGRTGAITSQYGDYNTSQVTENTNLYWTQARFDNAFTSKSTTNLVEGINQYHTTARARGSFSAGQQLSYNSSTGVFSVTKKQEAYSGITNASGIYAVTYSTAYASQPVVVPSIVTTDPRDVAMVTASSSTGFTIQVQRRVDVIGLLPTYSNRGSVRVDVVVLEL